MPVRPKKRFQKRGPEGLTDPQIENLISGFDFFDVVAFRDEDERRRAWVEHGDEILAMQGDKFPYFTRPHGWWACESKEMRKIIQGDDSKAIKTRKFKGQWSSWDCAAHEVPIYESERVYLERLNLLNERERELLDTENT